MKRGGAILMSTAVLATAACAGQQAELQIRQKASAIAQGSRPVPLRIAEARGQLALGNVALALESFRKAQREDPNSVDALAGMATCYDMMGRYELSRRYYESALALAPADLQLLAAFAGSLQLQGKADEALKVRREIALRSAPPAARPQPKPQQLAQAPAASPAQPRPQQPVAAPAARPKPQRLAQAPVAAPVAAPAARPQPKRQQLAQAPVAAAVQPPSKPAATAVAAVAAVPAPAPAEQVKPAAAPAAPEAAAPAPLEAEPAKAGPSVTVKLAAAAPAPAASSVTVKLPPAQPVAAKPAQSVAAEPAQPATAKPAQTAAAKPAEPVPARPGTGPRLERLSLGEIALVTSPGPVWRPRVVAQSAQSTTVRWVPLREASAAQVRVLNAARVHRLAARTRAWLAARGWRSLAIGDAPTTLARSVILYPRGQRGLARTLSNQFGFAAEERPDVKVVTMLLGRDAARIEELRPRDA